jgi:branched-chain amino acid transport system permease protein
MTYALQQLANGLPLAALYAALAFGYSLAFAITKRPDITYGSLYAFAGHAFLLLAHLGWNILFLTFPAALSFAAAGTLVLVTGLGILIGRHVVTPLARLAPNALTVASLGLCIALMEAARLASGTRELWLPPFMNRQLDLFASAARPVGLTEIQLVIVVVLVGLVSAASLFLAVSRWGRNWGAVAQDPQAAALCGVSARQVTTAAYGGAALMAGICGILASAHYGTMDFGSGLMFGLKVVLIASAGGHSRPARAALGAAMVGLAETLWSGYGPVAWRDVAVFSGLVVLLVVARRERWTI